MDEKKVREAIELIRMEISTLEGIENCGSEIEPLDIYADYCKWCGQRLDWTES